MAETADYDPGDWKGHDFGAARAAYTADAGRGYQEAVASHTTVGSLVPESIQSNSPASLVIVCDVTGSFGTWPGVIFSKLPYLDIEGRSYLGNDMDISFAAVGDAPMGDRFYLQVRPFDNGTALTGHLKELKIEAGGGGDSAESYELAAHYYLQNASFPNATRKPVLIFICDEGCHYYVQRNHAESVHACTSGITWPRRTDEIFKGLRDKYSVYAIRKHYGSEDDRIHREWETHVGDTNRVKRLDDPERVVDVIFGILAEETDKVDYFREEIEGRQRPEQVQTVYKSLGMDADADKGNGKSRMFIPGDAKKSKHLVPKSTDVTGYWEDVTPKAPSGKKGKK